MARMCVCGLNRLVHEGMNHISNVEVHLKTRRRNVNITSCTCTTIDNAAYICQNHDVAMLNIVLL